MNTYIKLFIGVMLFVTWIALVVCKVPDAGDIISCIKIALAGLGVYHLGTREGGASPTPKDSGRASIGLLALLAGASVFLAACTSMTVTQATDEVTSTQASQVSYTQACVAYAGAFAVALDLRQAGKLTQSQIDQVTLIDSQLTPLCTGPMPTNPTAAAQQITAAVTTLTILEAAQKAN